MEVDIKRIEAELQETAGDIHYRVHKGKDVQLAIKETDKRIDFYINPKRIRTQG